MPRARWWTLCSALAGCSAFVVDGRPCEEQGCPPAAVCLDGRCEPLDPYVVVSEEPPPPKQAAPPARDAPADGPAQPTSTTDAGATGDPTAPADAGAHGADAGAAHALEDGGVEEPDPADALVPPDASVEDAAGDVADASDDAGSTCDPEDNSGPGSGCDDPRRQ